MSTIQLGHSIKSSTNHTVKVFCLRYQAVRVSVFGENFVLTSMANSWRDHVYVVLNM